MIKKRKWGLVLILIGLGIIILFYAISTENELYTNLGRHGPISTRLIVYFDWEFSYSYPLFYGGIITLVGIGLLILSFFPGEDKKRRVGKE